MSTEIPILSGLRWPSNVENAAGNRSASKVTVARTAALRLRDVMTLPFVVLFIRSTNAAFAVAEPTCRTFRPTESSLAISNVPVDDHLPVISTNPSKQLPETDMRSTTNTVARLPGGAAFEVLAPIFAFICPTPQDAINLPLTYVS